MQESTFAWPYCRIFRTALAFFSVLFCCSICHSQSIKLKNIEYQYFDGALYQMLDTERGSKVHPQRIVVRIANRGDIRKLSEYFPCDKIVRVSDKMYGGYQLIIVDNKDNSLDFA
jgi:hypothetical protein